MQIIIDIPDAPIEDYQDLYHKIYGMAASEGLFDDKVKSQRALALKVVLDILDGIVNGIPLPKGHGRLIDISEYEKYFNTEITYDDGNHIHSVYTGMISTIIEADKAESEDKE